MPSNERPKIVFIGSDKGGVGKSTVAALAVDLLEIENTCARIVQIDDQARLPALFPGRTTTIRPVGLDDIRRDPAAIVKAFDPLYGAIERTIGDGVPTIIDIGGPQQTLVEEYCALADIDADLIDAGVPAIWLVPTTSESEAMRGAVRTARAVHQVLPSAGRHIVLNRRDGVFEFYPRSPAAMLWQDELLPLIRASNSVSLDLIAAGSWQPFEAAGKRFVDVIAAEIPAIQGWIGGSRPAAKVARGDVAAWLFAAQLELRTVLGLTGGKSGDD